MQALFLPQLFIILLVSYTLLHTCFSLYTFSSYISITVMGGMFWNGYLRLELCLSCCGVCFFSVGNYFICVKSAGHRMVSGWSLTMMSYGARPGIGRCYHIHTPAGARTIYGPRKRNFLKMVRCPGEYQIRRWCANRWNHFYLWPYHYCCSTYETNNVQADLSIPFAPCLLDHLRALWDTKYRLPAKRPPPAGVHYHDLHKWLDLSYSFTPPPIPI